MCDKNRRADRSGRNAENPVFMRVLGLLTKEKSSRKSTAFWRKRWDSNPRAREGYLISSQARYDHFDTLPCVLLSEKCKKIMQEKLLTGKFEPPEILVISRKLGWWNGTMTATFRVRPVMTTSIRFQYALYALLDQDTLCVLIGQRIYIIIIFVFCQ